MSKRSFILPIIGIVLTLALVRPSAAENGDERCSLGQVASFDLGADANGTPTIPVAISGHSYAFAVSPSASVSWVRAQIADDLGLHGFWMPNGMYATIGRKKTNRQVKAEDVSIGSMHGAGITFVRAAPDTDTDENGVIGIDILEQFDVDLDLRANKLKLFSQDHCPGKVVYWADKFGTVPFEKDRIDFPYFRARLDGKDFRLSFSLGVEQGRIGMFDASYRLGLDPADSKLSPYPAPAGTTGPTFSYPFAQLVLGDLTLLHPDILLYPQTKSEYCDPNSRDKPCYGSPELLLGRAQLKQLHVYFAFKEKMLYLTCADPTTTVCNTSNNLTPIEPSVQK